jgi:TNF receptor-associated factor 4
LRNTRETDVWFSPHFYTHPNGYKMCLGVVANGIDRDKGTHISVFVHMMQGEFDDDLKWPFRGKFTINMVNQEEDKNHVTWIMKLDRDSGPAVVTDRVVGAARNMKGGGLILFLRHTNL